MNFFQNLLLRLRLQRRRHRNIYIATAALLLVCLFSLLYLWNDFSVDELHYVTDPESSCGFLPSFFCKWKSVLVLSEEEQPFNPSAPSMNKNPDTEEDTKAKVTKQKTKPADTKEAIKNKDGKNNLKGKGGKGPAPTRPKEIIKSSMSEADKEKIAHIKSFSKDPDRLALGHTFYKNIFKDIIKAKPSFDEKLERYRDGVVCQSERYDDGKLDPFFSEEYLSSFLQLSDLELKSLTASHKYIMDHLPETAPQGLYEGDGIVYVGGGKFNWLTLLSIRSLRGGGCNLPVEILIPTLEEYDLELCTKVFPAMNAKCIYLPAALYGDDLEFASRLSFKGYQYKSLAILLSSFENVLLLDSDNIAAYSPEHLFKKEPFVSSGFVVWPDYWRRSTSPSFYKIAGQSVSTSELLPRYYEHFGFYQQQSVAENFDWFKEVPYHERVGAIPDPSSESGQLMVSKKSHLKAVLLALYYNSYGPKYFYPIFSQGTQGEGDKETFLAATVILNKPFYQVGKFLTSLGNVKHDVYTGHAMGQYDPVEDYKLSLQKKELSVNLKGKELKTALSKIGDPKMMFLHANFPKLDPWALREAGETIDKDGRHRLYGSSLRWRTGTDLEMDIWKHMDTILCEARLEIDHFKDIGRNFLCAEISAQLKHLENTVGQLE